MGGFAVDNPTLTRFFTFHFLLPFVVSALSGLHIFFLHLTGSNNPLGVSSRCDFVPFHCYYHYFDIRGLAILVTLMSYVVFFIPSTSWRPTILFLLILWSPLLILCQSDIFYLHMLSYALCHLSSGAFWPFSPQFWFFWYCPTLIGC